MSHLHSVKFLKKGGKCPTVIPTHFYKKEENVLLSFQKHFIKRRKMFLPHAAKFSQNGGKCYRTILTSSQKKEEENVPISFLPSFRYGRKIFLKALWEI